jgi:hypothetical protein
MKRAVRALLAWVPETSGFATDELNQAFMKAGREFQWIDENETAEARFKEPFFGSQSWSYPLFGSKDTARSFHGLLHEVIRSAGLDPDALMREIRVERTAHEKAEADRKAGVQNRRDERAKVVEFLKGSAPMEERIAKLDEILRERAGVPGTKSALVPCADKTGEGYDHLYVYLDKYYGGGINSEINRARIKKLEGEAYQLMNESDR